MLDVGYRMLGSERGRRALPASPPVPQAPEPERTGKEHHTQQEPDQRSGAHNERQLSKPGAAERESNGGTEARRVKKGNRDLCP